MLSRISAILSLLFFLPPLVQAQPFQPARERYRVTTVAGEHFYVTDGLLTADSITGFRLGGSRVAMSRDELASVDCKNGTHALLGSVIGGAAGAAVFALEMFHESSNPYNRLDMNQVAQKALFLIGGGATIGALVGFAIPVWEPVDTGNVWSSLPPPSPRISLSLRF